MILPDYNLNWFGAKKFNSSSYVPATLPLLTWSEIFSNNICLTFQGIFTKSR